MKDNSNSQQNISRIKRNFDLKIISLVSLAVVFVCLIVALFFAYDIVTGAIAPTPEIPQKTEDKPKKINVVIPETHKTRTAVEEFLINDSESFMVHLYVDGKYYSTVYSSGDNKTVLDLLHKYSVFLNPDDEINYSVDTPLEEDMIVKVGRVTYEYFTEQEIIPYEVEKVEVIFGVWSGKFTVGVPTEGTNGVKETYKRKTYVDGKLVETITLNQKITVKPKKGRIYVDCSDQLTLGDGPPSEYVRTVRCSFTSYTYVEEGGLITYTGDKTRVGYVAVDPTVIPIYSKLYIVLDNGFIYGYAYAMDTGGGIKGNKVDLFLPSLIDANHLGVRDGTVYIIREGKG